MKKIAQIVDGALGRLNLSRAVVRKTAKYDLKDVLSVLDELEALIVKEVGYCPQPVSVRIEALLDVVEDSRQGFLLEAAYTEHELESVREALEAEGLPMELVAAQGELAERLRYHISPLLYGAEVELARSEDEHLHFAVDAIRADVDDLLAALESPPEADPERWTVYAAAEAESEDDEWITLSMDEFLESIGELDPEHEVEWPDELETAMSRIADQLHVVEDLGGASETLEQAIDRAWDSMWEIEMELNQELHRRTQDALVEA